MLRDIFQEKRGKKEHQDSLKNKNQNLETSMNKITFKTKPALVHHKLNLGKLAIPELETMLERNERAFMKSLPDKGEKLLKKTDEVKERLNELKQERLKNEKQNCPEQEKGNQEGRKDSVYALLTKMSTIKLESSEQYIVDEQPPSTFQSKNKFNQGRIQFISFKESEQIRKTHIKLEQQHRMEVTRRTLMLSAQSESTKIKINALKNKKQYRDNQSQVIQSDDSDSSSQEECYSDDDESWLSSEEEN